MPTVKELFAEEIEPELRAWIDRFENPVDMLSRLGELFVDLDSSHILGEIHEYVAVTGPVHVGRGSVVHSNVVLEGPIIIGENVSIRSHAQIRKGAYIGSDCVIGHGADIKNSLCLNGSKIQDGTFVGDSILGCGARIGSGAILANRKFNQSEVRVQLDDGSLVESGREFLGAILGDYVRVGANAVLSPGTIIGRHTWVGSGVVLQGTHGPDLLITAKQELDIRPKKRVTLRSGRGEYEVI